MKVAIVVGNPKPRSRTFAAAALVAERLTGQAPDLAIDLADFGPALLDWKDAGVAEAVAELQAVDLLVVASPTYKATYTGLLKAFLDRYGSDGLRGVVAVPVMVGAAPIHYLAPEVYLRPLLVELGATVPARSLYVLEPDIAGRLSDVVAKWAATARPLLAAALASEKEE
jgi:FMN reductase